MLSVRVGGGHAKVFSCFEGKKEASWGLSAERVRQQHSEYRHVSLECQAQSKGEGGTQASAKLKKVMPAGASSPANPAPSWQATSQAVSKQKNRRDFISHFNYYYFFLASAFPVPTF